MILPAALLLLAAPEFKAGVARVDITPSGPIWLSGYAARTKPSEGVLSQLSVKALALEDRKGRKLVIITTDLIGLPRSITDEVSALVEKKYGLRRAQLLFNSSHTHTGPVVWPNLATMYFIDDAEKRKLQEFSRKLTADLFAAAGAALGDLTPVGLTYGQGAAGFAINRRQTRPNTAPRGPTDHSVPVIEARTSDGKRKAILFGYACHNTTLTGEHYKISADYAGFAQSELEKKYPGVTALFLLLCGGDQNPSPRGKEDDAVTHGNELVAAVSKTMDGAMTTLHAPLKSAFIVTELAFAPHTREQFQEESKNKDKFRVARANEMLKRYDDGRPIRSTPYPVQAIRIGKDFTLLALGGEVVVDYVLRAKKEFTKGKLVVAGYSNDVMCYIPSSRILREGGYEGETSMIYYGMPGKFADDVEDRVFSAIRTVMKRVGAN